MLKTSLCCGVALVILPNAALSQDGIDASGEVVIADLKLETVAVAGLRPQNEQDITTSVTVLDASDLAVRDNPYLADQLRAVPGLGVSRSGAAGGLTQVRVRGAEANHTLVLLNGIEVSDPVTGETDFGLFSGLNASRIEVARGEQSALFGSDAIGGVINVVTGADEGFHGLMEGGSRSTYRLDAGYGWDFDGGDLSVAFADVISDGVDTAGLEGEKDGYQTYSGVVLGGADLPADWRVNGLLRYGYGEVDSDPDLDFDGRLDNADRVTEAEQWTLGGALLGDAFGLNHAIRASFNQVERDNFADGVSADMATGERSKLAYSPSARFGVREGDVTLSGLIELEKEDYSVRDTQFGGGTDQDQSFESLGLAGEVAARFDALTLNASVRRDDNDGRFEDATTWRVGGAYRLEFGGKLRGSVGTGVKNPTFTELFGFFPGSFTGNPDLEPERSTSWEIGWDQSYDDVNWSLTYFEAALEDEIFTDFSSFPFRAANRAGDSERSGVEFSADWYVSDALSLAGALSNISSDNDSGAQEIRVPEWTGSLAVNWRSQDKTGLRAGLAIDYVGEQLDTDFGLFQTVELDPYALVSATAEYPLTERLSLTLRGENLLDEDVTDVFGFNGPGAGLFVGVRVR